MTQAWVIRRCEPVRPLKTQLLGSEWTTIISRRYNIIAFFSITLFFCLVNMILFYSVLIFSDNQEWPWAFWQSECYSVYDAGLCPNWGLWWESQIRPEEKQLVFKHPFGSVTKQAFQSTSKTSIVPHPIGWHPRELTLGDNANCYWWLENKDEVTNILNCVGPLRNIELIAGFLETYGFKNLQKSLFHQLPKNM